jgi:hypothetical protein
MSAATAEPVGEQDVLGERRSLLFLAVYRMLARDIEPPRLARLSHRPSLIPVRL